MNRASVESDLNTREPIFTIPQFTSPASEMKFPAAFIWSGLSQGGEDRYLPVLFDRSESEITLEFIRRFSEFSGSETDDRRVKPIVYQEGSSPLDGLEMRITHEAKTVNESEVDTSLEGLEPVRSAARHWKDQVSDRTLNYDRSPRDYGWLYRLQFMVYGTDYRALFPVFLGEPDESTLRCGLKEAVIPCVTIVPDDVEASTDVESVKTWIKPTIFSPQ